MKAFESIKEDRLQTVYISLTLDTRRPDNVLPVAVRINHNRRTIYHRTGLKCTIEEWDKLCKATGRGSKKGGDIFKIKELQLSIYDQVKNAIIKLQNKDNFTLENLKAQLTGRTNGTFSGEWEKIISTKKAGTANSYNDAYKSFTKFIGKNVSFDRISVDLIQRWELKMKEDGLSNATLGMYMRACRVAIRECVRLGYIKETQYPFGKASEKKVVIQKGRHRSEEYIDIPTIRKLIAFVAPESWNKGYAQAVYESIGFWIFSYLGNGMNLADMALLTYNRHYFDSGCTELQFIRKKTADTTDEDIEIFVPISNEVQSIIDRFGATPEPDCRVFPQILGDTIDEFEIKKILHQWNSNIRDRLRAACMVIGIEKKLSMTYARHSFATNLTHQGISERYISQAMGHSIKNVTAGYIALFPAEKRRLFNQMLLQE